MDGWDRGIEGGMVRYMNGYLCTHAGRIHIYNHYSLFAHNTSDILIGFLPMLGLPKFNDIRALGRKLFYTF